MNPAYSRRNGRIRAWGIVLTNTGAPDCIRIAIAGSAGNPEVAWNADMLTEYIEQRVVVDLKSPFVCLGTLHRMDENYLELRNADLHDLRDTQTTRELYVAESRATGIKRNRKRVLVARGEVVAISRLEDVVDE